MNSAHKDQGEEADLARLEAALARLGADPRAFPDVDAMASALGVGAIKLKDLPTDGSASGGIAGITLKGYTRVAGKTTVVNWPKTGTPTPTVFDTLDTFVARLVV